MKYINVKQAAEKWNIGIRRVQVLCSKNEIVGAVSIGKQWLIPNDAPRPYDRRRKNARLQVSNGYYHFPFFLHSPFYSRERELTRDEQMLRKAQIKILEGDFSESIGICRELIGSEANDTIKFGSQICISYGFLLVGLYGEYKAAMAEAEKIAANIDHHKADFELLILGTKFHLSFDASNLDSIDVNKLSDDALTALDYLILLSEAIHGTNETKRAKLFYETFCRQLEIDEILPACLSAHCLLAVLCYKFGDLEGRKKHIKSACDIAIKNGWLSYLSKYIDFDIAGFTEYLKDYPDDSLIKVIHFRNESLRNWKLIRETETGIGYSKDPDNKYIDMLILVSYNLNDEQIAKIKNVSVADVQAEIKEILKVYNLASRDELINYTYTFFNRESAE